MKRFLAILIIVLIIALIVLGGAWFFARQTAKKTGTTPPTFRQFLSIGGATPTKTPATGSISSVFSPNNNPSTTGGTSSPLPQQGVRVSEFTNNTLNPTNQGSSAVNNTGTGGTGIGSDIPGGGSGGSGGSGSGGSGTGGSGGGTTQPVCGDADLNINFTQAELTRLRALQNRFYAVAQYLHSDADVNVEQSNYDAFKAKVNQLTELYNYCQAKSPLLANATLKKHVPTPYWHDASQDAFGFISSDGPIGGTVPLDDMPRGWRIIERTLRINLW